MPESKPRRRFNVTVTQTFTVETEKALNKDEFLLEIKRERDEIREKKNQREFCGLYDDHFWNYRDSVVDSIEVKEDLSILPNEELFQRHFVGFTSWVFNGIKNGDFDGLSQVDVAIKLQEGLLEGVKKH